MILARMKRNNFRDILFKKDSYKGNEYIQLIYEDTDKDSGETRLRKGGITIRPDQWPEFVQIVNDIDITKDSGSNIESTVSDISDKFSPF